MQDDTGLFGGRKEIFAIIVVYDCLESVCSDDRLRQQC